MAPEVKDTILDTLKQWREFSREVAGFCIFGGFFFVLWMLLKTETPPVNKDALMLLLGILAGAFKDVAGFMWGGSMGSEKKTQALVDQANGG